jgi:hypothetical protein
MNSWHTYPSIFSLGHRAIADLLTVPVNVEEKVDGSQFSFGVDETGEIHVRSKGALIEPDAPEKMFTQAVETAKRLAPMLVPGWTYRAEYLKSPKHNTLAYDRIPAQHIIIFDINRGHEDYLTYEEKASEAARLGLEVVPLIYSGMVSGLEQFRSFLDRTSILGGRKIEGVVIKPIGYSLLGADKKVLMGKFVSEAFKEIHGGEWKKANPTSNDIIKLLANEYKTPARWNKGVQHMAERGQITDSPKDIGGLIKEVQADVLKECEEEIKAKLFKWAWPNLSRKVIAGLPEFYKEQLLKKQLGIEDEVAV